MESVGIEGKRLMARALAATSKDVPALSLNKAPYLEEMSLPPSKVLPQPVHLLSEPSQKARTMIKIR
jgi:hypothetical protein